MSSTATTHAEQRKPRMRLADFILANIEPILVQWETFARSIWPGQTAAPSAEPEELRDHAEAILRATVDDMCAEQTVLQQSEKSKGLEHNGKESQRLDHASDLHGAGRVESGFKLMEVMAEYRALRASVLRLWRDSRPDPNPADLDDLTRFHESIDQSLTRAVRSFTERVDQSRRLFLAILGHDLRNPLNAMSMSAQLLAQPDLADPGTAEAATQIAASATVMEGMINDLLDFTAAGLGGGMPLAFASTDLDTISRAVVDEIRAAHPNCDIRYEHDGDLVGQWDKSRLRQVVSNLLGNAVQHGGDVCRIELHVVGREDEVILTVHNDGSPIPPSALSTIFDPLRRLESLDLPRRHRPGSVGLGLYIAHQVVTAHNGTITVNSTAGTGTTFTVCLPRQSA